MTVRDVVCHTLYGNQKIKIVGSNASGLHDLYVGDAARLREVYEMHDYMTDRNLGGLNANCFLLGDIEDIAGSENGLYIGVKN